MKNRILKYHLEIFTALVFLFTSVNAVMFHSICDGQKMLNLFLLLGVVHEWEEKRFPGGFYDLMGKKFGLTFTQDTLDKAGWIVICYWLVVTIIPFIFDGITFLLLIPVMLNFFEAFVHTMGIVIHRTKKPYTPGMLSAWIMAAASVISILGLEARGTVMTWEYVLGAFLMFVLFLLMDVGIFKVAGIRPAEMMQQMVKERRK